MREWEQKTRKRKNEKRAWKIEKEKIHIVKTDKKRRIEDRERTRKNEDVLNDMEKLEKIQIIFKSVKS